MGVILNFTGSDISFRDLPERFHVSLSKMLDSKWSVGVGRFLDSMYGSLKGYIYNCRVFRGVV